VEDTTFWDMTPCILVEVYEHFRVMCSSHVSPKSNSDGTRQIMFKCFVISRFLFKSFVIRVTGGKVNFSEFSSVAPGIAV
jgi:hypothetical protein